MTKILVTGGAGNVGSELAKKLVQSHDNYVVIVDNFITGSFEKLPSSGTNWKLIKANVNNFNDISSIMVSYGFDYVFHYAALVGVQRTLNNPTMVLDDIQGIKNILDLAKNTGVKRIFFSSSSEVYGEPVEYPQNEDTTPLNSKLPYAIVKNVGEAFLKSYKKVYNLDYTIFRFFNTYGPNQSKDFVIMKFLKAALANEPITIYGDGGQTRTFCYVDDNIEATTTALYKNLFVNDVINIGSDHEMSIRELAELVIKLTGSSSQLKFLPPLEEGDMTRRRPDISKMKTLLNRDLLSVEDGIKKNHRLDQKRLIAQSHDMTPRISIITINRNNADGLQRTIESVKSQSTSPFEHIIIDGGSQDGSIEVAKQYAATGSHIKWVSEPDNGIHHAMNKGISMATGDYCFFLHSGDSLHSPAVLAAFIEEAAQGYDLIYGNIEKIDKLGRHVTQKMPATLAISFMLQQQLYRQVTFIKKELFDRYGKFDENLSLASDWEFFFRCVVTGQASSKYRDMTVTIFPMDGLTSKIGKQKFIQRERDMVMKNCLSPAMLAYYEEAEMNKRLVQFSKARKLLKIWYLKYPIQRKFKQIRYSLVAPFKKMGTRMTMNRLKNKVDYKNIPIIINNYNRLTYLLTLIGGLEKRGYKNIHIIDNKSTYPPLLEYYKTTPYKVYMLRDNVGLSALWDTEVFDNFRDKYYVLTDSDLQIADDCPDDFMLLFYVLLNKYSWAHKVGFSLRIGDLPDHYKNRDEVVKWEKSLNKFRIEYNSHASIIDTTFALYRPVKAVTELMYDAIRVSAPYEVYHLPWYEDAENLDPEQQYYYDNVSRNVYTHWSVIKADKK